MGPRLFRLKGRCAFAALLLFAALAGSSILASAQVQNIPAFWQTGERLTKPDMSGLQRLRFLTTTDFPPFNFIDRRKRLSGFHVDLARAICHELGIVEKCQIQALPWEELETAMQSGDGDAIIAGLEVNAATRVKYEFSRPYLQVPGRFVALRSAAFGEPMTANVRSRKTGLISGSQHEKWFKIAFNGASSQSFATRAEALAALAAGKIDMLFADAVSMAFWLTSKDANDCCVFAGGPYLSQEYFGHGMAVAFPKGRGDLSAATDYALKQMSEKGVFAELYLRYFPLSLF